MVNINHFWKIFTPDEVEACKKIAMLLTVVQEIYCEPEWENFYVDYQSLENMMFCVNAKKPRLAGSKIVEISHISM